VVIVDINVAIVDAHIVVLQIHVEKNVVEDLFDEIKVQELT
jgi:hypothetical protein